MVLPCFKLSVSLLMCLILYLFLFYSTGYVFQIHLEQLPPHSGGNLHSHDTGYASCPHRHPTRHRGRTREGKHPHQTCKIEPVYTGLYEQQTWKLTIRHVSCLSDISLVYLVSCIFLHQLFQKCQFIQRIIDAWSSNEKEQ